MPRFVTGKFKEIVRDGDQLHLRVGSSFQVGASKLTVVSSEPFDKQLVGDIAKDLGEITLYTPRMTDNTPAPQGKSQSASNRDIELTTEIPVSSSPEKNANHIVFTAKQNNGTARKPESNARELYRGQHARSHRQLSIAKSRSPRRCP